MKSILVVFFIAVVVTDVHGVAIEDTDEAFADFGDLLTSLEERTMDANGIATLVAKANVLKKRIADLEEEQTKLKRFLLSPVRKMESTVNIKEKEQAQPNEHVFRPSDFGNLKSRCSQVNEQLQGFSSKITV